MLYLGSLLNFFYKKWLRVDDVITYDVIDKNPFLAKSDITFQ